MMLGLAIAEFFSLYSSTLRFTPNIRVKFTLAVIER